MTVGPMSNHELRNRLNTATIGLSLVQKHLGAGTCWRWPTRRLKRSWLNFSRWKTIWRTCGQSRVPRRKALLVEDDANESELLAGFLRLSGFRVDRASDGCDALEYLAEQGQPDVVLLDMQMPRCDGPTTIQAIRQNPAYAGLRVFAVSGRVPADMGVTVGPTGVNRWFRKPLNPQSLVGRTPSRSAGGR